ncbi:MAG: NADH-quinone oxidoreductase subunit G [Oxalobacter sp.]|nr:MAG: NADH-quinone oxidoreductase subunit G [Oxalobacter sp.]
MIEIDIDGKKVKVPSGTSVIEAANRVGVDIPHFCYHKKLSLTASCRMCLVEIENVAKPVPACATPATAGMKVHTHSHKAVQAQKAVMEFLLINHPLDCPICDQGGECRLQDIAMGYGQVESRFTEEKRIVFRKNAGPLIAMEEMSRCIHCTRCVRFGQEVAGIMELGMLHRGEHAEITTFVGKTIDSELSGNMIDFCPVGALTSKPFRYTARGWELTRNRSISPHDGLGANLIIESKNQKVMRVLPLENEAVNECWISDKDRFSYEALNSAERLTKPMIKQGNQWHETDWQTALEYIGHGLDDIKNDFGAQSIAALASPHATLEELTLLNKLMRGIGSSRIDARPRQTDRTLEGRLVPWLGMPIAEVGQLQEVLVVGSFLRKDHPLLAARLRQSANKGAQISMLHAVDDDTLMPIANRMLRKPSEWQTALAEMAVAIARIADVAAPAGCEAVSPSQEAQQIAASLMSGRRAAILLGNAVAQHPQASQLHAMVEWIAQQTSIRFGYLTEAANTVGASLACPASQDIFTQPAKAYILLHAEPELDCANPVAARAALEQAKMVVVMSPFKHSVDVADVLLPIAPFTETSGTFVNAEGRAQSFNAAVRPLGETRPGWKVLRVLGNVLNVKDFEYESSEQVRDAITQGQTDLSARLKNVSGLQVQYKQNAVQGLESRGLERLADVPIYFADPIVRRARSLKMTNDAKAPKARMATALMQQLGIKNGVQLRVSQGRNRVVLEAMADDRVADGVVRIAAADGTTAALGSLFGELTVEKV